MLVLYASSYVLVSTALDRYVAICHPLRSHPWTPASAHRMVAVAWLIAGIFAVPQLVIFDFVEVPSAGSGVYDCWDHFWPDWTLPLYVTWFAAAVYVVPLLMLTVIYIRICSVVWRSAASAPAIPLPPVAGVSSAAAVVHQSMSDGKRSRSIAAPLPADLQENGDSPVNVRCSVTATTDTELAAAYSPSKAKTKTVKLTLTVVASYVICWGPFIVAQLWSAWDKNAPFEGTMPI